MTTQILSTLAITVVVAVVSVAQDAPPPSDCAFNPLSPGERRVFTNADLDRIAACRKPSGSPVPNPVEPPPQKTRGTSGNAAAGKKSEDALEAYWRAQWRSVDQRAKKLRREARELREESAETPRDPKKRPTGRRSPTLLLVRALALENEAKELETEFEERARREGALPGWIRAKTQ